MYTIKHLPEDFIVKETGDFKVSGNGRFIYALLKKKNYTTLKAVATIAKTLGMPSKFIGFAGNKDKAAITEQMISIRNCSKARIEQLRLIDIALEFVGYGNEPISLGDLEGNSFTIVVRNITAKPKPLAKIKNFFGEQRFSGCNADIGKVMVQKDFEKAVELLLENEKGNALDSLIEHLAEHPSDTIGALHRIPKKLLMMYIHAYQSKLWNEMAAQLEDDMQVPIIGFGTELPKGKTGEILKNILERETIAPRDFIIRGMPELSSEGTMRELYAPIKELQIGELDDDELNKGMKKCCITFSLPKGSYATEVIKALFASEHKAY